MSITRAQQKDIGELINNIEVCHMMIRIGKDETIWNKKLKKATVKLGDNFGIQLPMYTTYKNEVNDNAYKLNEYAKLMCNLYEETHADVQDLRIILSDWNGLSDANVDAVLKQASKLLDEKYYWIGSNDNE